MPLCVTFIWKMLKVFLLFIPPRCNAKYCPRLSTLGVHRCTDWNGKTQIIVIIFANAEPNFHCVIGKTSSVLCFCCCREVSMEATWQWGAKATAALTVALVSTVGAALRPPAQTLSVLPRPCFGTMVRMHNTWLLQINRIIILEHAEFNHLWSDRA